MEPAVFGTLRKRPGCRRSDAIPSLDPVLARSGITGANQISLNPLIGQPAAQGFEI